MIRKLLITLTVVLGTIGVGWGAVKAADTALELRTTSVATEAKTAKTFADLKSLLSSATSGSTITLSGTITLTEAITVPAGVTLKGASDTDGILDGEASIVLTNNGAIIAAVRQSLMDKYNGSGYVRLPSRAAGSWAVSASGTTGNVDGTGGKINYSWEDNKNMLTLAVQNGNKISIATNPASYGSNAAHWVGFRLNMPTTTTLLSKRTWQVFTDENCTTPINELASKTNDTDGWDYKNPIGWAFYQSAEYYGKIWLYKTSYKMGEVYNFEVFKFKMNFGETDLSTELPTSIGSCVLKNRAYSTTAATSIIAQKTFTINSSLNVANGALTGADGSKVVIAEKGSIANATNFTSNGAALTGTIPAGHYLWNTKSNVWESMSVLLVHNGKETLHLSIESALTAAVAGDIIRLAAGTYELTTALAIDKSITIEGTDSTTCIIKGNIEINGTSTQAVTFKKVKINSTATAINITNPQLTLTLDAVSIDGTYGVQFKNEQATEAPNYIVKNSHIHASTYYALWTRSQGTYNWTIENSVLDGWCALYMSLGTPKITVTNSHLYGTNIYKGGSNPSYANGTAGNGFATIVFESTNNGTLTLNNTDVHSLWGTDANEIQNPIIFQVRNVTDKPSGNTSNNIVTLNNKSSLYIENPILTPIFIYHSANVANIGNVTNNWVKTDGTATFSYAANKKQPLVVKTSTGDIRTVIAPEQVGIDNLNYWTADNDIITVPVGTIELTKPWEIQKAITLQGAGADKTIIKGAITIKGSSTETAANVAIKGIKFDYSPTALSTGRCQSLIQMIDGKTNLVVENSVIENRTAGYGYGYGTSSYIKMQNVFQLDSAATGTLKITNTQIHLLANNQRAISAHGQLGSVSLINTRITGLDNGTGQYQYGACIHRDNTVLTLDNSTITLNNHYGIWVIKGKGQQIHITNKSLVSGYGALYLMYPSGVHAIVSGGSTLTGITKNNGPSDSFGAIIFEGTTNSTVEIVDSYVGNQFKATQTASMTPILINNNSKSEGNTVKLKGKSIVRTLKNATNPFMVDYGEYPDPNVDKNYVVVEGTEVQFKDETDKDCIVINNQDGTFRNAAVTVVDAIVYGSVDKGTYYQWAIANKGDMVMATETVTTKVLSLLNAAKDQFFVKPTSITTWKAYAVPDSIVINCKDAYLVTGEKAAKAFAATERDKAVFWLKQEATAFSTVAVGNNWRIIDGNTTWNDAANVNRSVEIKAGAKLTINVAMALDSVRMDEGAELITALPVTAKTLQAKYTVAANKWKPFAFPVSEMTVKDANDDKTVTPIVQNATTGVWFAGLSATIAPIFEHKNAFAQAGIIAANAATEILVASPAAPVSLTTKPEPTAPTAATAQFLFVANPNLFAMTLTQTAYVLNEAGTAFERRDGAVIKPFQSYVLADAKTTATLRSLRVDGVVTENEIIPTEGYYVESAQGAIVIHTAESVVVEVVDMTGRIVYKAQETMDGCRIALPAGIYAVNRQMVIVK